MEITIIKEVFITEEIEDPDSVESLETVVKKLIKKHNKAEDWEVEDWRDKEVYKVYDTHTGSTLLDLDL